MSRLRVIEMLGKSRFDDGVNVAFEKTRGRETAKAEHASQ